MERTRHERRPGGRSRAARVLGVVTAAAWLLAASSPVSAVEAPPGLSIEARALVGGHIRIGSWTTVEVDLRNSGPAIVGELRLTGDRQGRSTYGTEIDLPTGSEKRYFLYAQPSIFRTKIEVLVVSGQTTIASASVPITSHDPSESMVAVVAERPQALVPDLTAAAGGRGGPRQTIMTLAPADLPPRVEAWTSIDRLIWQDVDSADLTPEQRAAMTGWLASGGRLVILGGTTGIGTLAGFPDELLPFRPTATVDIPFASLTPILGSPATGEGDLPALSGELERGTALLLAGEQPVAAEAAYGQGMVTVIGFDPGHAGLAGTAEAQALWRRLVPAGGTQGWDPMTLPDDSVVVGALGNIPAVSLPALGPLLFVLVGYIVVVGPVNYLVLKRLDRREWAWLTIPAAVVVFAVASYGLGALMKGTEVIVNQIGIVRAGTGTEEGMAQVYVGVFSPSRQRYDVRVKGGALLSNPISSQQSGAFEQPLDVLFGETSRLRGYQVGFGALRGFRAEGAVKAPVLQADLRFEQGRLVGRVENRSSDVLEGVALVFGDSVVVLDRIEAGAASEIDLAVGSGAVFGLPLSERLYGVSFSTGSDADSERTRFTRRTVIDQLTGYGGKFTNGQLGGEGAILLAWRPQPALDVELSGQPARSIGQTLYLTSWPVSIQGEATFPPSLMRRVVLDSDAVDAGDMGGGFSLSRGTMTVELRPVAFKGDFEVSALALSLTQGEGFGDLTRANEAATPLPEEEQPPQDDPLGQEGSSGGIELQPPRFDGIPEIQLFDRLTSRWIEFEHIPGNAARTVDDPERYVDSTGGLLVRFVNRSPQEGMYFQVQAQLQGVIR